MRFFLKILTGNFPPLEERIQESSLAFMNFKELRNSIASVCMAVVTC